MVTTENYGEVNYRLLVSCFKFADSKITQGVAINLLSNPLI